MNTDELLESFIKKRTYNVGALEYCFEEWDDLASEAENVLIAAEYCLKLYKVVDLSVLESDMSLLNNISEDYENLMHHIKPDKSRILMVRTLYIYSLEIVKDKIKILLSGISTGLLQLCVLYPFEYLQHRAIKLLNNLKELEQQLKQVKREKNEAWVQLTINTSLAVILLLIPPITLLAAGALAVGQWALDDLLGPKTSIASKSSTTLAAYGAAADKMASLGKKSKFVKIGQRAGKLAPVVGCVFDVNEVLVGYRNINVVKSTMNHTRQLTNNIIHRIEKSKQGYLIVREKHRQLIINLNETIQQVDSNRNQLMWAFAKTTYIPGSIRRILRRKID